jgi:hypothetical protein
MQHCPQSRAQQKHSLAAEVLRRSGRLRLVAMGQSMMPILWPGDRLTVRAIQFDDVTAGDLVLFREKTASSSTVFAEMRFQGWVNRTQPGDERRLDARSGCSGLAGRVAGQSGIGESQPDVGSPRGIRLFVA